MSKSTITAATEGGRRPPKLELEDIFNSLHRVRALIEAVEKLAAADDCDEIEEVAISAKDKLSTLMERMDMAVREVAD